MTTLHTETYRFRSGSTVGFGTNKDQLGFTTAATTEKDWFDQQTLTISDTTSIKWNNIVRRPGTSAHAASRSSRFDELHIVVIDTSGEITGNAGTILEKHESLSKATDAKFSAGSSQYWRKHLEDNSEYIFGLGAPTGLVKTGADAGVGKHQLCSLRKMEDGINQQKELFLMVRVPKHPFL